MVFELYIYVSSIGFSVEHSHIKRLTDDIACKSISQQYGVCMDSDGGRMSYKRTRFKQNIKLKFKFIWIASCVYTYQIQIRQTQFALHCLDTYIHIHTYICICI